MSLFLVSYIQEYYVNVTKVCRIFYKNITFGFNVEKGICGVREPYWSWYGFKSRVEWCATFVSWCANECGYIEAGIIPKFAGCQAEGVEWFKTCGLWKDGGYTPSPRRYYIF